MGVFGPRAMSAVKEAFGRLAKKFKDVAHLNPEYVGRQFDTAPARFKDGHKAAGFKGPGVADQFYTEEHAPNVPTLQPGRSKFNIRYFDRDTRRAFPKQEIYLPGASLNLIEGAEAEAGEGAVLTGIEELPQHLPLPSWYKDAEAIEAKAKANGLPPAAGAPHKYAASTATGFAA